MKLYTKLCFSSFLQLGLFQATIIKRPRKLNWATRLESFPVQPFFEWDNQVGTLFTYVIVAALGQPALPSTLDKQNNNPQLVRCAREEPMRFTLLIGAFYILSPLHVIWQIKLSIRVLEISGELDIGNHTLLSIVRGRNYLLTLYILVQFPSLYNSIFTNTLTEQNSR